jgi:hypothetical protein
MKSRGEERRGMKMDGAGVEIKWMVQVLKLNGRWG